MPEKMSFVAQYKEGRKPLVITEEMRKGARDLEKTEAVRAGDVSEPDPRLLKKIEAMNKKILEEEFNMIKPQHDESA